MNKLFVVLLVFTFVFGQFARLEFGNGIALIGIDVLVGLIATFWLGKSLFLRKKIKSVITLPILVFVGIGLQSLILSLLLFTPQQVLIGSLYLIRFLSYIGLYYFIREFSKDDTRFLVKGLIAISCITVTIGGFQYIYYPSLQNLFYLGWDDHLYRLFSVFLDPNFTGALFVCFFLFLLSFFKEFRKLSFYKKIGLTALIGCTGLSIFLTYSRTALLMLVGGGIIYLFLLGKKKLVGLFLVTVVIVLILTVDTHIEGLNPFRVVSTNARINSFQIATDIFSKHPLLGVGFNTYRYAQNIYGYRSSGSWQTSHADSGTDNSFLFVLVTTGFIGFGAYLFLWYRVLNLVIVKVKTGNVFAMMSLTTIVSLFIGALFLNVLFYPFIMAWYFILIALTENTSQ